jgi:hypothetical protein
MRDRCTVQVVQSSTGLVVRGASRGMDAEGGSSSTPGAGQISRVVKTPSLVKYGTNLHRTPGTYSRVRARAIQVHHFLNTPIGDGEWISERSAAGKRLDSYV